MMNPMTKKSIGPILLLFLLIGARAQAQNYSIAPSPFLTAFDNSGLIINGACIWTYGAGTTTPVTTYADTMGTPNSNPIQADSAGRFTAFLVPGNAYKFVYEAPCTPPAHGATLRTADQILGTPIALPVNQIAPVFNVQTGYGAAGNGTTDDTMAIQSAINACGASTYGGTVFLPAGTYKTTVALTDPFSNCAISGAGRLSTTITTASGTADILDVSGAINDPVTDLAFNASVTRTAGAAITVSGNNGASRFARLHFLGTQFQCLNITSAQVFWIQDNTFDYCQNFSIGVQSTATANAGLISGNFFLSIASGNPSLGHVYQQTGVGLRVTNNTFFLAGGASLAINLVGGSGAYIDANYINASASGGTGIAVGASATTAKVQATNDFANYGNFTAVGTNASTTTNMGYSPASQQSAYINLRLYGAKCDGTTNIDAAVQAAIAAGEVHLFLPPGCLWNPPGNNIPGGLDILGGDIAASKIWATTPASNFLGIGPQTILRNLNTQGEGCNISGSPIATGCPTVFYMNNDSSSTVPIQSYPYEFGYDVGANATSGTVGLTAISVIERGNGGGIYGQYNGGLGANAGSGINAAMAYQGATGQGLAVSQLADGTGALFANGLASGAASGGTCCLRPQASFQSTQIHGDIIDVFDGAASLDGHFVYVNFPAAYTGDFIALTQNNVLQHRISAGGNEYRTGIDQLSASGNVSSASTIAPTTQVFPVTGAATIATITAPAGVNAGASYCLYLLGAAGSSWTVTTGGNIAAAHAHPGVGHMLPVCWDPNTATFFPAP